MTTTLRTPLRAALAGSLLLALCTATAPAQQKAPTVDDLIKRYEEEIALPFVAQGNWVLDYDEALARAKAEDKLVFAYFSRSYAH